MSSVLTCAAQGEVVGLAPLLRDAFHGVDLAPAAARWLEDDGRHSAGPETLHDLSLVLELLRRPADAAAMQQKAMRLSQSFRLTPPSRGSLRLLVVKAAGDLSANTPVECLLEGSGIGVELLYVAPGLPLPAVLPEHDLIFVAVAESSRNRELLEELQQRSGGHTRPVLNLPSEILKLDRATACRLLGDIGGMVMAPTAEVSGEELKDIVRGTRTPAMLLPKCGYPVLVRPRDSHAGRGLARVGSTVELAAYLREHTQTAFFLSRFIDYSSPDGLFRKYRIVLIEGRAFLCHMGISSHWMVHYPYAEMLEHPERREEEARAMQSFDEEFAVRHRAAFEAIQSRLRLDYFGLDCAETKDGRLLVFEPASAMLVHNMDRPGDFPYKAPQMQKVFTAFRAMLRNAVAGGGSGPKG